ncbi:hypothetical protein ACFL5V_02295 [Fibrobacterota bacterium]
MFKKMKLYPLPFIFLSGIVFMSLLNCSGNKPKAEAEDETMGVEATGKSQEVEESKQAAESAEWEAHRLREELNRKKKASQ